MRNYFAISQKYYETSSLRCWYFTKLEIFYKAAGGLQGGRALVGVIAPGIASLAITAIGHSAEKASK